MSELAKKRVRIFLKNGFCFNGIVLNEDTIFIKILDDVSSKERYISKSEISDLVVI